MNQTDYFTEKIATLPEDLQDAIRASNHQAVLKDIQREHKLHIDQAQALETLTSQLIFGDIDAPQFVNNMFNEAHVSSAIAGDMLLAIDTRILKNIRAYLERIAEQRKQDEELKKLLMEDEELEKVEKAEAYAEYYANTANILEETKQELLDQGIASDGSNITDEMIAEVLGMAVEEYKKKTQIGAYQEASQKKEESSIPQDVLSEKEELLRELESPEKSFVKPLFANTATPTSSTTLNNTSVLKQPVEPKKEVVQVEILTPPDHQLQNTHVETPYTETVHIPHKEQESGSTQQNVQTPEPVAAPTKQEPLFKKPTKITLSNDPYREPIE